ncbi:MAG: hypothetical protein HYU77_04680 [Betaproteobacteria bacterium]|nr:hypothetical protein [Betaproteobacteria bacterium]
MLAILLIGATYVLLTALNRANMALAREQRTADALAQAKAAVIAYAATYGHTHAGQTHGFLPCPDRGSAVMPEGSEQGTCNSTDVSALGRLPWRSLGLPPPKDGSEECLWYAVSGRYKSNPKTAVLNWDTNGQFEVVAADGATYLAGPSTSPDSLAVAVIFAPQAISGGQSRGPDATFATPACGGNYTAANYLDNDTVAGVNNAVVSTVANGITRFIAGSNPRVNDRIAIITKDEIYNAMMPALRQLTEKTAQCVAYFGTLNAGGAADKRLPWGSPVSLPDYTDDCQYNDQDDTLSGRLSNLVGTSGTQIPSTYFASGACPAATNNQLFKSDSSGCPGWTTYYPLWSHWKSFLFLALADDFKPSASAPSNCGDCLEVNGAGNYAGIVMFAGKTLSGQTHATNSDKASLANYLEGRNLTNHPNSGGDSNYQTGPATASFNDVLYCVAPDLSVAPCP